MNTGNGHSEQEHIRIAVVTTSGTWPEEDFVTVPIHQKIRVALETAARKLNIVDVSTWVAKVAGRDLDLEKSWLDNDLSGVVTVDFGPREGGGGSRA
jgi:hypothetical protein